MMIFPSKQSYALSLLVTCLVVSVTYAAWWDKSNSTNDANNNADDLLGGSADDTATVPFPGRTWLDTMALNKDNAFAWNGVEYTSAYDALLNGTPEHHLVRNFNAWLNSWLFSTQQVEQMVQYTQSLDYAHYVLCYLRNFVGAMVVYYGTSLFFHYHIYIHPRSQTIFKDRERPSWDTIWDQIKLSQASMFLYITLPVLDEYLIEQGWTQVYYTVDDIGGYGWYAVFTVIYFALVEIGIYWMHRTLHTNKFLYKHVHMLHHKYNKPETLSPWASIAFNPLDGILQASPYVLCLPLVPCHYLTHFGLLFFTAVWATYIHDSMDFNIDPIMGSKYHTMHHTHYIYNYGQVFTFCDQFWGTLRVPQGKTGVKPTSKTA
mmetsp:Transcript_24389/g.34368  ORF Transcript_24389/g.34368 Transcript_24389/m.34368 type:complete len:375 (-) Transcript_24389:223-1347(-)